MKTERLNGVIFYVSALVFVLQCIGFLAPGWFVHEMVVRPDSYEVQADSRRFTLHRPGERSAGSMADQALEEEALVGADDLDVDQDTDAAMCQHPANCKNGSQSDRNSNEGNVITDDAAVKEMLAPEIDSLGEERIHFIGLIEKVYKECENKIKTESSVARKRRSNLKSNMVPEITNSKERSDTTTCWDKNIIEKHYNCVAEHLTSSKDFASMYGEMTQVATAPPLLETPAQRPVWSVPIGEGKIKPENERPNEMPMPDAKYPDDNEDIGKDPSQLPVKPPMPPVEPAVRRKRAIGITTGDSPERDSSITNHGDIPVLSMHTQDQVIGKVHEDSGKNTDNAMINGLVNDSNSAPSVHGGVTQLLTDSSHDDAQNTLVPSMEAFEQEKNREALVKCNPDMCAESCRLKNTAAKDNNIPSSGTPVILTPETKVKDHMTSMESENVELPGPGRDVMAAGMLESLRSEDQVLYLTAGLWFSRACVTTRKSRIGMDRDGTRWCTLYSRIDNTFPSRKKRPMLELRVEATLATVFAAVSFLVAALGCCSSRHHGRRAIAALTTMFLSGAIMMIPVVHMIIHHNMAASNHVNKPTLTSNYIPHDLAGHYSIIVAGIGSLIAVLAALLITVVKCRSPSELGNEYNLDRKFHETDDRKEKHELPIHWIRKTNIALPPVTASTMDELHGDDSESGYSDLKDEDSTSESHEPCGQPETA